MKDSEDIFSDPIPSGSDEPEPEQSSRARDDEPFFDIDTDIRPDTDPAIFDGRPEYARDEYGEYGSIFDKEEDNQLEDPDEEDRRLERLAQEFESMANTEEDKEGCAEPTAQRANASMANTEEDKGSS